MGSRRGFREYTERHESCACVLRCKCGLWINCYEFSTLQLSHSEVWITSMPRKIKLCTPPRIPNWPRLGTRSRMYGLHRHITDMSISRPLLIRLADLLG